MTDRIVAAEVLVTSPGRNYVTLKISTADGLVGWGDATLNGCELAVDAVRERGFTAIRVQTGVPGLNTVYGVGRGYDYEPALLPVARRRDGSMTDW